jgi:pectin methylesterase-like acyl-CoA thioesterase
MSVFVRRHRARMAVLSLAVFVCFSPFRLSAATVVVGTCKNLVQFSTIQAAINASPSGSTVEICPATYTEQLTIAKSITLSGVAIGTSDAAVIVPPAGGLIQNATDVDTGNPIAAQVFVQNPATTVNIANLTVGGTGNGIAACSPDV